MTTTVNLVGDNGLKQGADYGIRVTFTNQSLDLTGATATASIKEKYTDTVPLAQFECVIGQADPVPPATGGDWYVDLILPAADSLAIKFSNAKVAAQKDIKRALWELNIHGLPAPLSNLRTHEGVIEISPTIEKS